jgi:phospho-N-acetylmuramoyl-pentapeptide-transferase
LSNFFNWIHIVSFLVTLVLALILSPMLIPFLTKLKFGQTVRDDGPTTHFVKTGTPTMGGIIFLIPVLIVSFILSMFYRGILPLAFVTMGFGVIGFIDDFLKVVKKSKDGLFALQKMIGLLIIAILFLLYIINYTDIKSDYKVMFCGFDISFGFIGIYFVYVVFVLLFTTNAVNITDGLDGLATGVTIIVFLFFSLYSTFKADLDCVKVFSAVIAGGCLGFLAFNLHPAKIFMGDTGSLALGGAVGALTIMAKLPPVVLVIIGGIYVIETLSVIIQVVSFKTRGKRVFKMAPIHHHFELCNWKETKVVAVFWSVTIILCIIGGIAAYFKIY